SRLLSATSLTLQNPVIECGLNPGNGLTAPRGTTSSHIRSSADSSVLRLCSRLDPVRLVLLQQMPDDLRQPAYLRRARDASGLLAFQLQVSLARPGIFAMQMLQRLAQQPAHMYVAAARQASQSQRRARLIDRTTHAPITGQLLRTREARHAGDRTEHRQNRQLAKSRNAVEHRHLLVTFDANGHPRIEFLTLLA